ncbi:uncharacterized protein IL334_003747 [Kwoniella shivajii]|uniref:Major facilitator superfamily (MFS) profile domain-containing protein n=1 Tax=Kwoniella shivajii TaxID=564305 RepID=A0ABZ1D075_9TREE|nr:hypothetical protein IL334_003747 [Kwoniella shivajii]
MTNTSEDLNHIALSTTAGTGIDIVPASAIKDTFQDTRSTKDEIIDEGVVESMDTYEYPEGGYGWIVVGCCMTFAALTMGWGVCFGVFQAHYAQYEYPGQTSKLSLIGSLFTLLQNITSFVAGKRVLFVSAFVYWLALFLASWSTKLWQVILTQGVLTGIGVGICQPMFFSLPSQWFHKRRGLVSGLTVAGAGFGGGFGTLIVRALIKAVGAHKTLLIYSFINLTLMLVATLLMRTRPSSPEARMKGEGPWVDKRVWTMLSFHFLALCILLHSFGYLTVLYYLTQYMKGLSDVPKGDILGALPLSLLNFCAGLGRISIGYAADRLGAMNTFAFLCFGSFAAVLALWLPAHSYGVIVGFGIVYGLLAPASYTLVPMAAAETFGPENLASNVGLILLFTAPGGLGGALVGGKILEKTGNWQALIIYAAALHAAAGICILVTRFLINRRIWAKV